MSDDPLFFLIVDDSPGRYEELTRLLDDKGHRWAITHDEASVNVLLHVADVLVLDHDMPGQDGRARARNLARSGRVLPVIITSTTGVPNARETMLADLVAGGLPAVICPADHHHCEIEWLAWAEGAAGSLRLARRTPR